MERCRAADLLVAHAGMGSICSTPLIVVPCRAALGETRNDHRPPLAPASATGAAFTSQ